MDRKSVVRAANINSSIVYKENDLKDIQYYEKNYSDYPIAVRLKRTGSTTFGTTSEILLYDEKLKKEILNLIKIHFVAEIQRMEKELEEV